MIVLPFINVVLVTHGAGGGLCNVGVGLTALRNSPLAIISFLTLYTIDLLTSPRLITSLTDNPFCKSLRAFCVFVLAICTLLYIPIGVV